MAYSSLTPMPDPPLESDNAATFDTKAYATVAAMGVLVTEINALDFVSDQSYTSAEAELSMELGTICLHTLTETTTFTDSLTDGQRLVVQLTGGNTYGVTWPTVTWISDLGNLEPGLTAADILVFWKVQTTLFGMYIGSFA